MLTSPCRQKGFTLLELMVVVAILGILAAIAYPNFVRYVAKSKQAEAKINLAGIYVAQRVYYTEYLRFGGFAQIGFAQSGTTNQYTYRSVSTDNTGNPSPQPSDVINSGVAPATAENITYAAASGTDGFTATATANIDQDGTLDQWYVNDRKTGLEFATTDDVVL